MTMTSIVLSKDDGQEQSRALLSVQGLLRVPDVARGRATVCRIWKYQV
jgi:hypothetical protein